jgi:hypothetical protein
MTSAQTVDARDAATTGYVDGNLRRGGFVRRIDQQHGMGAADWGWVALSEPPGAFVAGAASPNINTDAHIARPHSLPHPHPSFTIDLLFPY